MPFVTAAEAARIRGVNPSTVSRWIAAGLKHTRVGKIVLIDRKRLDKWEPAKVGNPTFGK